MPEKSVLDVVTERGILRIAVAFSPPPEEGHPPEFYRDKESGEPSGVVCELGKIMAKDLGVEPEFVDISWPEHMEALLSGRVDLLMSYTNTPARALAVEFAGPLLPSQAVVAVPAGSSIQHRQALNRPDKCIGVWHGSSIIRLAQEYFPQAAVSEHADATGAVTAGRIDACVVDAVTKIFMNKHPKLRLLRDGKGELLVLGQEWGHPAIKRGDQLFLNWLDNWLDYHREGAIQYWCHTWWQSWMVE